MDARDRLPEPLRRCVGQTIAAEALEGWQPTADHIDALVALVDGDVAFTEYLAEYRTRYPSEPTRRTSRRVFRPRRTYLIPGTTLLRNNFGADSHRMLSDLEFVSTAGRIACWHRRLADGDVGADDLNIRAIQRELFSDVYPWAGNYRVTELRRGEDVFAWRSSVHQMTARVEVAAREVAAGFSEFPAEALAYQLARLYADFNHIHPFREGNGRTGTMMLHIVATLCDRRLDLSTVSRDEWYAASRDSMPFRRDGRANHRPFLPLFIRAVV